MCRGDVRWEVREARYPLTVAATQVMKNPFTQEPSCGTQSGGQGEK